MKAVRDITDTAKVLSDDTRVKIVIALYENSDKEMCVYEIAEAVGASQSATSHQLARLEDQGVVSSYRDGQRICYELKGSRFTERLISTLNLFNV